MKRLTILFAVLAVFLWVGSAMATNITIDDNRNNGGTGWYGAHEDQEVEPGMVADQSWDLEGFFLNGTTLTMVGGFNFAQGTYHNSHWYESGDIFLDIDGNATYGDSGSNLQNGYDYVIDLDFSGETYSYNVYSISSGTLVDVTEVDTNRPESSPWRYTPADGETSIDSGTLIFTSGLSDADTGFDGGTHYAASVDLAWLLVEGYTDFTSHFTMECGNDNLMGHGTVPEPATMLLFGTGLIGMAVIGRKKFLKKQG